MNSQFYCQARELGHVHARQYQYLLKDVMERIFALCLLVLFSPLMILIALLVKLDSPGPVFFTQYRHGKNARVFKIYKFRTMTKEACGEDDVKQAVPNDPRITRTGRFLRRYSIDEWPQFYNILKGDMALLGPRPLALEHNNFYGKNLYNFWLRYAVKPGLSGMAQVMGSRGETPDLSDMQTRLSYDLYYVRYWNLWMDVRLALMTLREIFFPRNAY